MNVRASENMCPDCGSLLPASVWADHCDAIVDLRAQLQAAHAERDRLRAALALIMARCRDPNVSATENYERVTEEYYRDTGLMAPGRDVPVALGGSSENRALLFRQWEDVKWAEAWAAAKKVCP